MPSASALPIIVGVVCGVLALTAALVAWFLVKRRRLQARNQHLTIEPKRHSRPRHSSTMTLPIQAPSPKLTAEVQNGRKSTIGLVPPLPRSKAQRPASLTTSVLQTHRISVSFDTDLGVGEKHSPPTLSPMSNVNMTRANALVPANRGSLEKAVSIRSADSASVYSVASVAPEIHDRVFKPQALETIPASPLFPDATSWRQSGSLSRPRNEITSIPEELAPETYDKWRPDTNHGRRILRNTVINLPSLPISSVTPTTPTPSAALPGRFSFPQALLEIAPLSPPPARSPLRDVQSQWIDS